MNRFAREPLLHFIVLGAALFALHAWVAPPLAQRIELSDAVVRGLRQEHLRRTGAPPSAEEEAAMIQRFIDNEVLYREALSRGLDRGDIIVRRRLVQKMEFLIEDVERIPEPTDEALQAYFSSHQDRYVVAERVAFTQVFAGTERNGSDAEQAAARLRPQLLGGADPAGLGDPFLRGREFPLRTEPELAAVFGPSFAAAVMALPVGSWSEPLRSSYGFHLVRVAERRAGHAPALAEVRAMVRRDWRGERRAAANRAALERLRGRYDIRVADAADGAVDLARK